MHSPLLICVIIVNDMLLFVCHLRVSIFYRASIFVFCRVVVHVILNIYVTYAYLCFYYVNTNVVFLLLANIFCLLNLQKIVKREKFDYKLEIIVFTCLGYE